MAKARELKETIDETSNHILAKIVSQVEEVQLAKLELEECKGKVDEIHKIINDGSTIENINEEIKRASAKEKKLSDEITTMRSKLKSLRDENEKLNSQLLEITNNAKLEFLESLANITWVAYDERNEIAELKDTATGQLFKVCLKVTANPTSSDVELRDKAWRRDRKSVV